MKTLNKIILLLLICLLGAGCNSGGGSDSTINTPVPDGTVTSSLTIAKTSLLPGDVTTVKATFMKDGKPLSNLQLIFTASPGLVRFFPSNGQVVTNLSGEATVTMQAADDVTGVGQVTVSALVNGAPVTQLAPFFVDTTALKLDNMVIQDANLTIGQSTFVTVDIRKADGSLYTDQAVDVYFTAQYGFFEASNGVGRVRSSGGKATARYRTAGNLFNKVTDTIHVTFGASTVTGYITINPAPVVPGLGALALTVAPASAKPGDFITCNVTLTNPDTSISLSGVPVTINSSRPDILATTPTVTDAAGKAIVNLQVSSTAPTGSVVSLYASSGAIQSASTIVTIGSPPAGAVKLTLGMIEQATWGPPSTSIIVQGNDVTFVDAQGLPIANQPITISVDRIDGWVSGTQVTLNGILFSDSATPNGVDDRVTLFTDTSGKALIPTKLQALGQPNVYNFIIYWRAVTTSQGVNYSAFGSTLVTVNVATAPSAPANVTATVISDTIVDVTFTAPANTGGSAITGYTITSSPGGGTDISIPTATTHRITNLTAGTSYVFTVVANNAVGSSAGVSASSVRTFSVPAAPTGVTAIPGAVASTMVVTFVAPANGGTPITGYTVTPSPATPGWTDLTPDPTSLTHTIDGLTTGVPYTFTVKATNSVGTGAASLPSLAVNAP